MRKKSGKRFVEMICALSASAAAAQVFANSGIQLPLSQYQAGQEQATQVTNGGFEQDGKANVAAPSGWLPPTGSQLVVNPVYSPPPLNPPAIGSFSAQASGEGTSAYDQNLTGLLAGHNYVISAYIWNSGRYDGTGNGGGDLATVKVVDPLDSFKNVSMTLEGNGSNGASGSTGRFMYTVFNQSDTAAWTGVNVQVAVDSGAGAGTLPSPWAQFDNIAITPVENFVAQKWLSNVSGNWTDDGKWLGGVNPQAQGGSKYAIASFSDGITSNQTISVNAARTIGGIDFNNATASYTIAGPSTLSLDVSADLFGATQGVPEIDVLAGNHTISANVILLRNLIVNVIPANGSLTTTGTFNVNGRIVSKRGSGLLTMNNVRSVGLNIEGGMVRIAPNSQAPGVSKVTALTIAPGAKLDLNDNKLITQSATGTWGGSAYDGVTGLIASGRNGNSLPLWDGATGIITSQTQATGGNFTSIGVATAQQVKNLPTATNTTTWGGQTVTGSDTLVMYTYGGDANLDGKITVDDYGRIDFNVGLGTAGWFNGDFNYDGKVTVDDYGIIDFNVGIQGTPFFTASSPLSGFADQSAPTAVPEPTLPVLAVGVFAFLGRRRRLLSP